MYLHIVREGWVTPVPPIPPPILEPSYADILGRKRLEEQRYRYSYIIDIRFTKALLFLVKLTKLFKGNAILRSADKIPTG